MTSPQRKTVTSRCLLTPYSRQAVDDPFGVLLLVLPLYIAFERDPSVRDGHLEVLHEPLITWRALP